MEIDTGSQMLRYEHMQQMAMRLSPSYQQATPFPHIVIDDFLDQDSYFKLSQTFPGPEDDIWYKFRSGKENLKLQSRQLRTIPQLLKHFIYELNGPDFVEFLEVVTGIKGLVPDPHLYGGGLHQTLAGGHLGVHVDYNYHTDWKLDRRLNVILYLNDDWQDSWGGHLELWNEDMSLCKQKIAPIANRMVIFNTSEKSWHGHPDALACPPDRTRKSIALYYYSNGRPEEERASVHNTVFKSRPGEKYKMTYKDIIVDITPPAMIRLGKKIMGRY